MTGGRLGAIGRGVGMSGMSGSGRGLEGMDDTGDHAPNLKLHAWRQLDGRIRCV